MVRDVLPNTATANDLHDADAYSDDEELHDLTTGVHSQDTYPAFFKRKLAGPKSDRFVKQLEAKNMKLADFHAKEPSDQDAWLNENLYDASHQPILRVAPRQQRPPPERQARGNQHKPAKRDKPPKPPKAAASNLKVVTEVLAKQAIAADRASGVRSTAKPQQNPPQQNPDHWHKLKHRITGMFSKIRKHNGESEEKTVDGKTSNIRVLKDPLVKPEYDTLHSNWETIEHESLQHQQDGHVSDAYCKSKKVVDFVDLLVPFYKRTTPKPPWRR